MARIGFLSTMAADPWGGSEELWVRTAQRLTQAGHEVGAEVRWWPELAAPLRELQNGGVRLFHSYPRRSLRGPLSRLTALVRGRAPSRSEWMAAFRPDVVVINTGMHTSGASAARACRRRRIPYALLVHAASEHLWPVESQARALAEAYEGAEHVFVVAEANRATIETQLGMRLERCTHVRNPFKVPYEGRVPFPGGETLRLACVGRLAPQAKGQDLIFEVLARPRWRDRAVEVSLYGAGPHEQQLRRLAKLHDLSAVHFAGVTGDVRGVWAEHHALLLPSRYEGTPLVVIEAMLSGRPCIVTPVAGRELVVDGDNGFVAQAPTADLVDEAMERAWSRREDLEAMGQRAAKVVREYVPPDPVGAFVESVEALLATSQRG